MQTLRVTAASEGQQQNQQRHHPHQHIHISERLSPNNISGGNPMLMRGGGGGDRANCRSPQHNSQHSSSNNNTLNNSSVEQSERSPSQPLHHNSSVSLLDNGTTELMASTVSNIITRPVIHASTSHTAAAEQSLATDMIAIQNDYLEPHDQVQEANTSMAVDHLQDHQQSTVEHNRNY